MKKLIIRGAVYSVVGTILFYIMGGFVSLEFDMTKWTEHGRFCFVLGVSAFSALATLFAAFCEGTNR